MECKFDSKCGFYLYANNAKSKLAEDLSSDDNVLYIDTVDSQLFPDIKPGTKYNLLIVNPTDETQYEIVTAVSKTRNAFTIERGQEGTLPKSFPAGSRVELRLTSEILESLKVENIYDVSYLHVQAKPEKIWSIPHKLNYYPNVLIFDDKFNRILDGFNISYPDENTVEIFFNEEKSGYALLLCDPLKVYEEIVKAENIADEIQKHRLSINEVFSELIEELISRLVNCQIRDAATLQGYEPSDFLKVENGRVGIDRPIVLGDGKHRLAAVWTRVLIADRVIGSVECADKLCHDVTFVFKGDTDGNVSTNFEDRVINVNLKVKSVDGHVPSVTPKPGAIPVAGNNGKISLDWLDLPPKGLMYFAYVDIPAQSSGSPVTFHFDFSEWYEDYCSKVKYIEPNEFLVVPIATFSIFRVPNPHPKYESGTPSLGDYYYVDYNCSAPEYIGGTKYKFKMKLGATGTSSSGKTHSYSTKGYCGFRIYFYGGPIGVLYKYYGELTEHDNRIEV